MTLSKRCVVCRKDKLWFRVKHRSFVFPLVSSLPLKSNDEMCGDCFKRSKEAVFKGAPPNATLNGKDLPNNLETNGQETEGGVQ